MSLIEDKAAYEYKYSRVRRLPIKAPRMNGLSLVNTMELVGRFPSKTYKGKTRDKHLLLHSTLQTPVNNASYCFTAKSSVKNRNSYRVCYFFKYSLEQACV